MPVLGPGRCPSITTTGFSVMAASPRASVMRQKPPPDVAVIALRPAKEAPTTEVAAAISLSDWTTIIPASVSFAIK